MEANTELVLVITSYMYQLFSQNYSCHFSSSKKYLFMRTELSNQRLQLVPLRASLISAHHTKELKWHLKDRFFTASATFFRQE